MGVGAASKLHITVIVLSECATVRTLPLGLWSLRKCSSSFAGSGVPWHAAVKSSKMAQHSGACEHSCCSLCPQEIRALGEAQLNIHLTTMDLVRAAACPLLLGACPCKGRHLEHFSKMGLPRPLCSKRCRQALQRPPMRLEGSDDAVSGHVVRTAAGFGKRGVQGRVNRTVWCGTTPRPLAWFHG